jgi:hypothetical protein
MEPHHIKIAKRLLKIPGVKILYDAQKDTNKYNPLTAGDLRGDTHFESVALDDPSAEVFTHYLSNPGGLSEEDDHDLSYHNACTYGEETPTLQEQKDLVRARYGEEFV